MSAIKYMFFFVAAGLIVGALLFAASFGIPHTSPTFGADYTMQNGTAQNTSIIIAKSVTNTGVSVMVPILIIGAVLVVIAAIYMFKRR